MRWKPQTQFSFADISTSALGRSNTTSDILLRTVLLHVMPHPHQQLAEVAPAQHAGQRVGCALQPFNFVFAIDQAAIRNPWRRQIAPFGDLLRLVGYDESLDLHALADDEAQVGPWWEL